MSDLEDDDPPPSSQSALAYLAGEVAEGVDAPIESTWLLQDTAGGDAIEASFNTDVAVLRRRVEEKAEAAAQALQVTQDLRDELAAARAEASALRETLLAAQGEGKTASEPADPEAVSQLISDAFAEMAKVRTDASRARQELEQERNEHRAEMIQARAQFHAAQEELQQLAARPVQAASRRAPTATPAFEVQSVYGPHANDRKTASPVKGLLVGCALVTVVVAATVAVIQNPPSLGWLGSSPAAAEPVKPPSGPPAKLPPIGSRGNSALVTPSTQAQFQGAVARLNGLLSNSQGKAPKEMLREMHELYKAVDPSVCDFDWRKGQPALVYAGGSMSLGQTIQHCADAIELNR